ncbi:MAG TPA: hypothetical protein DD670_18695 [Planctomycetaceae bacterium]|nr:hypothetical protein [Planctomycetaceae bacterium]
MKSRQGVLSLLAAILSSAIAVGGDASRVNDWGNSDRLVVEGCRAFPSSDVKSAIGLDLALLLESHPAAPLDTYLAAIANRVRAGYLHMGFPNVRVDVRIDEASEKVHVVIEEGPRYTAGQVIVRGNREVSERELVEWLVSPCPPDDSRVGGVSESGELRWIDREGEPAEMEEPLWKIGKPVFFDEGAITKLTHRTRRAMASQGFFPLFAVKVVPQEDGTTATLGIDIFDEGSRVVLNEIKIEGNDKNSRDDILEFLDLKPGMSLRGNWKAEIEHKLWRSGRFIESHAMLERTGLDGNHTILWLRLVESPAAPRLSEPLSPAQEILVRFDEQITKPGQWPGDLVLSASGPGKCLEFVASPKHGFLGRVRRDREADMVEVKADATASHRFDCAFAVSDQQMGISLLNPRGTRLWRESTAPLPVRLIGNTGLRLTNELDTPTALVLGLRAKSLKYGKESQPFEFRFDVDPAYFVAMPDLREGSRCSIEDGVLQYDWPSNECLRVDAATGRLVEWVWHNPFDGFELLRVVFEEDAFKKRLAEIEQSHENCPNQFDPAAPWSSCLKYFCNETIFRTFQAEEEFEPIRLLRLLRMVHERQVLESLVSRLQNRAVGGNKRRDKFTLPPSSHEESFDNGYNAGFLSMGLRSADLVFVRQTWPWTLSREVMLMAAEKSEYSLSELARLSKSYETGPLFCLAAAMAYDRLSPQTGTLFLAYNGLEKLSVEYFEQDCRTILDSRGIAGQYARRVVRIVRELEPEEVEEALRLDAQEVKSPVITFIRTLRSQPDDTDDEALFKALNAVWTSGLRDLVEQQLTMIRDRQRDAVNSQQKEWFWSDSINMPEDKAPSKESKDRISPKE